MKPVPTSFAAHGSVALVQQLVGVVATPPCCQTRRKKQIGGLESHPSPPKYSLILRLDLQSQQPSVTRSAPLGHLPPHSRERTRSSCTLRRTSRRSKRLRSRPSAAARTAAASRPPSGDSSRPP